MGNAAIVDLGDRTVVFDTMYTPKAGLALREAAEQLLGRPVSLVINSHFHFDHVGGNQVFSDAIILSTETTKNLMLERCTSLVQFAKQHPEYPDKVRQSLEAESDPEKQKELRTDLGDILALDAALPTFSATPASLTFSDSVTLHGSKRTAVLTAKGNGHSTCDSVLYLPEDRVLLAGDLLFVQNHPSMQTGNLSHWVSVLKAWKTCPFRQQSAATARSETIKLWIAVFTIWKLCGTKPSIWPRTAPHPKPSKQSPYPNHMPPGAIPASLLATFNSLASRS